MLRVLVASSWHRGPHVAAVVACAPHPTLPLHHCCVSLHHSVFYKQRDNSFFPPAAYVLSFTLTQLPQSAVECTMYSLASYWLSGLTRTAGNYFLYLLILFSISNGGWGRAAAALLGAHPAAALLGAHPAAALLGAHPAAALLGAHPAAALLGAHPAAALLGAHPAAAPHSHGFILPPHRVPCAFHDRGQCGRRHGRPRLGCTNVHLHTNS